MIVGRIKWVNICKVLRIYFVMSSVLQGANYFYLLSTLWAGNITMNKEDIVSVKKLIG